ncbi:MAG TPA: PilX N-terminal domain-containing pilus assembly protein [Gammaproteobacteria bacterium]|nr:PilX N-terminal domain-containing pilus assembly protein [Gammaproteobacteria bacterium]
MRNVIHKFNLRHSGAATLVLTIVLLTLSTLLIIFAAEYGKLQSKSISNISRSHQAFEAAQAGLEFGINYLDTNSSTINATSSGGYINYSDSNTTNVTQTNSSKFSVVYTNPIANNYNLIKITSTGTSDDGSSIHTISQLVQYGSMLLHAPTVPLISQGSISLGGNSQIINVYNNTTMQTGGSTNLNGSASTILNSGTSSTAGHLQSDIQSNLSILSSQTNSDFFSSFFGLTDSEIKTSVDHYYSSNVSTNYSTTLNGMNGTSIWVDQTGGSATLGGSSTIGTTSSPVLLIVNGNTMFSGNLTFYGFLFILGTSTTDLTGNVTIIGGMSTTGNLSATGSIQVIYSPSVLTNLQNINSMNYYAKVPGSWSDF